VLPGRNQLGDLDDIGAGVLIIAAVAYTEVQPARAVQPCVQQEDVFVAPDCTAGSARR